MSYDGGKPVQGVKIAGQSGELDPRKLNMDVSRTSIPARHAVGIRLAGSFDHSAAAACVDHAVVSATRCSRPVQHLML